MAVEINFTVPRELASNSTIKKHLWNIAKYIRDYWIAKSPSVNGEYVKGLLNPGSIKVIGENIIVRNLSKHAQFYEFGHRAFNIGMKMLNNGRGVYVSKEGFRYKRVKISDRLETKFRKESVSASVSQSFMSLTPMGLNLPVISKYGATPQYQSRKSLQKMLKPGKVVKEGADCLTISEKTIRLNPSKWLVPAMQGRHLAKEVQKEVRPLIMQSLHAIVKAEKVRQRSKGRTPQWSAQKRGVVKVGPVQRMDEKRK
jgi:hypothetical protein